MRHPSAGPLRLRLLLSIGVVLLAGPGCSREPAPAPPAGRAAARPSSETPSAGPVAPPPPAGAPGSTTRGEIVGVRYLEHMTGGARPDEDGASSPTVCACSNGVCPPNIPENSHRQDAGVWDVIPQEAIAIEPP